MRDAFKLAISNIVRHGDTDIFPLPFENRVFFDKQDELLKLLLDCHTDFEGQLARFSPLHVSSLTPVTYTGFRWATQLDPFWNAYFLGCVLKIANVIEKTRIAPSKNIIFSYRFKPDLTTGDLFNRNYSWVQFMEHSLEISQDYSYVVICDISEFYSRLNHHKLENALLQLNERGDTHKRIMTFLENYTSTRSFGLPIGGPAARILSELTLNQIDRLLEGAGVKFVRFADDFHLFAQSREDAYRALIFLSQKLIDNQGLSLQKAKTRILSAAEFRSTSLVQSREKYPGDPKPSSEEEAPPDVTTARSLLRFSIRFDPYSPTAQDDYELLRKELSKFDIIGLLQAELGKSRLHTALSKKIVSAIRYLDDPIKNQAILTIVENCDLFYPIFSSILVLLDQIFDDLSVETQTAVVSALTKLIADESHILRIDVHMAYAIRVLAHAQSDETQRLLHQIYLNRTSELVRRDIILTLGRWNDWPWMSDLKNRFRQLSSPERRAFLVTSYTLRDEGSHWRKHIAPELTPFDKLVRDWASEKINQPNWRIPL